MTRRAFGLLAPYRAAVAGGVGCVIIVTAAQLFVPRWLGITIDRINQGAGYGLLNMTALVILAALALRSLFLYGQISLAFFLSHRVSADLRQRAFEQVQRWSLARFARWTSGDLIARALSDTQLVQQNLLVGLFDFAGTVLTVAGILVMLFVLDWRLAVFTLVAIPVLLGSARAFGREIQRTTHRAQARAADLAVLIRQAVGGARVIRAFAQEAREIATFRRQNERTFGENLRISQLIAAQVPIVSLLTALGLVAVLWLGARLVAAGSMTIGTLVSFLTYAGLAVEPAVSLSRSYGTLRQGLGALERIVEIIDADGDITETPGARELPPLRGAVQFRNVSFAYEERSTLTSPAPSTGEGRWALRDVSLIVAPGERVAIVGPSGAGKTTLVNLIPRFYDPTEGAVEIDGADLRGVTLRSLRRQIGLVPQETVLFVGTVHDNIAYGRPEAARGEVVSAARAANAHEFIEALPQGYDTVLGEEGIQLSGGQRQRLAIARAILHAPRVIILDEATSALDPESEQLIQEAFDRLMEGRTTFIIAHRLSTVLKADRIIVLERGQVIEQGRHDELMALGGTYARLAGLQLVDAATGA